MDPGVLMPDLPRFAMHFGAGLDRETGLFAAPPGSMEELVNVYVSAGKAEMRRGLAVTCEHWLDAAGDPLTADYVVLVEAMRAEGVGIVVLYDSASGDVHVVCERRQFCGPRGARLPVPTVRRGAVDELATV